MHGKILVVAVALLAAGCAGASTPGAQGPPSAQTVAQGSSDFSGVQRCGQSGSYDKYLRAEQTKAPDRYTADKKTWDDLKSAGANDSYIAAYADTASDCDQFASTTLQGKVAEVFAVRFKDSSAAESTYTTSQTQFHLTDSDVAQLKAFGATVLEGEPSGLGKNSTVVRFDIAGSTAYIALWQNKEFEVALVTYNLPLTAGPPAVSKINSRVR